MDKTICVNESGALYTPVDRMVDAFMFKLNKFSLIIITRCNLRCRFCCEYVPQHKPFADMTVPEADRILSAAFEVLDYIGTLHLTGGGEPFLHPQLAEMITACMRYSDRFDRLMLFTNSTVPVSAGLMAALKQYRDQIVVQVSHYGIKPDREQEVLQSLLDNGVQCKVEKYYGDDQSFGGWVDFGPWESYGRSQAAMDTVFHSCAVTRDMGGNWRTRDGKVHWCSRSQRGMELGLIPDCPDDYVDLFDDSMSRDEKQDQFRRVAYARNISACNYCSGEQGTRDDGKRLRAAEQTS